MIVHEVFREMTIHADDLAKERLNPFEDGMVFPVPELHGIVTTRFRNVPEQMIKDLTLEKLNQFRGDWRNLFLKKTIELILTGGRIAVGSYQEERVPALEAGRNKRASVMKSISFSEIEMGGGNFMKFPAGQTQSVFVLAGPVMIANKFNEKVPKPAVAVWNTLEKKVQVMDLKSSILDVLKMLEKEGSEWNKTVLKIRRTGEGKQGTSYTAIAQPVPALEGYEKLQKEGEEMLSKISVTKSSKPAPVDEDPAY